jgi:hypothetical protein
MVGDVGMQQYKIGGLSSAWKVSESEPLAKNHRNDP